MKTKILLIGSDETLCYLLSEQLAEVNYLVESFLVKYIYVVDDVLKGIKITDFDLIIIVGLRMPGIYEGEALLEHIKKNYPTLPVIVSTACSDKRVYADCFAKGADAYIKAPYNFDSLLETIEEVINRKEQNSLLNNFPLCKNLN